MKPKISIIMPVFNAEDSLLNTINSLFNQTFGFDNLELILIDDYSTDDTKKIIKYLTSKYVNITSMFLNKNSGSASRPRNYGLNMANSEYIMFLDSDDLFTENMCEILYSHIKNFDADVVSCRFYLKENFELKKPKSFLDSYEDIISIDTIYDFPNLLSVGFPTALWNKIYKKSVIEKYDIYFPDKVQNEDIYFSVKYLLCAKNIVVLNNFYGYVYAPGDVGNSISVTFKENNLVKMTKGLIKIFNLLDSKEDCFRTFKGEMLLGWTKWFLYTNLNNDKILQNKLLNQTKKYYKDFEFFTKLNTISLPFNILVNICFKLFGLSDYFLIVLSYIFNKFI